MSGSAVVPIRKLDTWRLCMDCGVPRGSGNSAGWLSDTRPTLGGGVIHVELCYRHRHLTVRDDPLAAIADLHRWMDETRRLKAPAGK